ncbi:hypothetical protein RWH45_06670 [Microbacterium sp. KSW4-17]|uniref:Uncharacterized protein n=1 Tax=Microbacterium galbum TaxID=3075994 RepID=A0ABU3T6E1_9MICO|nr:hypothetical protein [Microbacterium sp. KSW4-17]MDU0366893.1 hypothetical protein [Microbacterium sp. KSW4-17]
MRGRKRAEVIPPRGLEGSERAGILRLNPGSDSVGGIIIVELPSPGSEEVTLRGESALAPDSAARPATGAQGHLVEGEQPLEDLSLVGVQLFGVSEEDDVESAVPDVCHASPMRGPSR